MLAFTKTCARDAERVAYQVEAVAALGLDHIVLVELGQIEAVEQAIDRVRGPKRATGARLFERLRTVEGEMPEAMRIRSPYLRQQYCKLVAPLLWGDMLQIDSDMCPFAIPAWPGTWHYVEAHKQRREVVLAWAQTYAMLGFPYSAASRVHAIDFMGPCKGWWVPRLLARHSYDAPQVLEALLRVEAERLPFSEYQALGYLASLGPAPDLFTFTEGEQPAWCYHFTGSEPLTETQRSLLAAAGQPR